MKYQTLAVLLIYVGMASSPKAQAESAINTWKDEGRKILYFVPNPVVSTKAFSLKTGDFDFDTQLDVSFSYTENNPETAPALEKLRRENPDYRISRALLNASGDIHVRIPSLQIDEDLTPLPGMEGPYLNKTYYLNRNQASALKGAYLRPQFISVSGKVGFVRSMTKQLEYLEMGPEVCVRLFSKGPSLFSVLSNFTGEVHKLEHLTVKHPSTLESIKSSILAGCIDETVFIGIRTFEDLFSVTLSSKIRVPKIFGETVEKVSEEATEEFHAYQVKEGMYE
ncbi:MAG: hypothetical protein H7333_08290 [Bdellovibrionales bacterium]|nr:hypothetical protein [Oligoflexia bacterium]